MTERLSPEAISHLLAQSGDERRLFLPGQIFLEGKHCWKPHNEAHFRAAGLFLLDFWGPSCYHEVLAFGSEPIHMGLVECENVPFLVYRLGRHPWSDVPFIFDTTPLDDMPDLDGDETGIALQVIVIDADTGRIRGIRQGLLSETFSRELREMMVRGLTRRFTLEELRTRVDSIYRDYPTSEALASLSSVQILIDAQASTKDSLREDVPTIG